MDQKKDDIPEWVYMTIGVICVIFCLLVFAAYFVAGTPNASWIPS